MCSWTQPGLLIGCSNLSTLISRLSIWEFLCFLCPLLQAVGPVSYLFFLVVLAHFYSHCAGASSLCSHSKALLAFGIIIQSPFCWISKAWCLALMTGFSTCSIVWSSSATDSSYACIIWSDLTSELRKIGWCSIILCPGTWMAIFLIISFLGRSLNVWIWIFPGM